MRPMPSSRRKARTACSGPRPISTGWPRKCRRCTRWVRRRGGAGRQYCAPIRFRDGLFAAIRYPRDARLRPDRYVSGLAASLRGLGGVIDEGFKVDGVVREADGVRVRGSGGDVLAGDVVFATGAWTPTLVKSAGLAALPMQPGKGYSITYTARGCAAAAGDPARAQCLRYGLGQRLPLGQHDGIIRYDSTLNRRRFDALERGAAEYRTSGLAR